MEGVEEVNFGTIEIESDDVSLLGYILDMIICIFGYLSYNHTRKGNNIQRIQGRFC